MGSINIPKSNLTKDFFFFFGSTTQQLKTTTFIFLQFCRSGIQQSSFGWFYKTLAGVTQKVTISGQLGLKHHRWLYYMSGALEWIKKLRWISLFVFLSVSMSFSLHVFLFVVFIFLCGQLRLFYIPINPTYPVDLIVHEAFVAKENMVLSFWHAHYGWITVQKFEILEKSYIVNILIFP